MLHTAPSFSIYNSADGIEGETKIEQELERVKTGERFESLGSSKEFTFGKSGSSMDLIEERDEVGEEVDISIEPGVMYLATGLGFGEAFVPPEFDDVADAEGYYKKMVDENPSNALFLGNYAKILESKGDLEEAEDYYFRASFIDPEDGEILMLYAKLVWQLHQDRDRAQDYFQRAVLASPRDSDVLAAHARFLWDIEEETEDDLEETEDDFQENNENKIKEEKTYLSNGDNIEGTDTEDYYKRMVDENPLNSIALRNYAHFLYMNKGDLIAAEDNYKRAILADPADGEIKSEYAKLIWHVHHDRYRALCCFEEAVIASPEDSNVLGAYARFLWEAGESEEDA